MLLFGLACLFSGCASTPILDDAPQLVQVTPVNQSLLDLPPPERQVTVAVYYYEDQTGQYKPSDTVQTLSRAVTQGASSILIKALQDAGNRTWFKVVERKQLDNLLKERQIIKEMRRQYLGETQVNPKALPPLLFAGILLEGGVISYDTNSLTGGVGARYLGIGGDVKYRQDTVTVYLRATSTRTGEVLLSVNTQKTIASVGIAGSAFKFIDLTDLVEAEAGVTHNEPTHFAVQQSIEKAVHALVITGAERGLWKFADPSIQKQQIAQFSAEARIQPVHTRKQAFVVRRDQ